MTFEELGLKRGLLERVKEMGFKEPTEVQRQAIPLVMKGEDIMVQSKTGSGKTGAFILPLVEMMDSDSLETLVIVPTRELAMQVHQDAEEMGSKFGLKSIPIYGGASIGQQIDQLSRKNTIIATPGRLMDIMKRGHINLKNIKYVVLDEADRMLDMGFEDDIRFILSHTPKNRQTLMFSATIPHRIQKLAEKYMNDPKKIMLSGDNPNVDKIKQTYYATSDNKRLSVLGYILQKEKPELAVIFCNTKRDVNWVEKSLFKSGYNSMTLHGDLTQSRRDTVIKKFKEKHIHILVASDVAARGLHINGITHVINYGLPDSADVYLHRIGRTGRAGRDGKAISIVTQKDTTAFNNIRTKIKKELEREEADPDKMPKMFIPEKPKFRGKRTGGRKGHMKSRGGPKRANKGSGKRRR